MYTDVASAVTPSNTSTTKVSSTATQAVTTSANGSLTSTTPTTSTTTSSNRNGTYSDNERTKQNPNQNGMLERSLYVAIGISALVAIYFIVRWMKTKGRRKAKKYGVIHGTGELELQPLDKHMDEDEEDMTLFDVKDAKRPR
ncbi:hypothetical protein ACROYT_G003584 [Oculina patagonica]